MLNPVQRDAVGRICAAAWECCRPDINLAAFTAAQCVFESAYLTRCPGNNCFGIKASDGQYSLTHEYLNGKWEEMPQAFATYPSLSECFAAHAQLLRSGVYAGPWSRYVADRNINNYIRGVSAHYATDPAYAEKMIAEAQSNTIRQSLAQQSLA